MPLDAQVITRAAAAAAGTAEEKSRRVGGGRRVGVETTLVDGDIPVLADAAKREVQDGHGIDADGVDGGGERVSHRDRTNCGGEDESKGSEREEHIVCVMCSWFEVVAWRESVAFQVGLYTCLAPDSKGRLHTL